MSSNDNALHFFLGAHTSTGFINEYYQFQDPTTLKRIIYLDGAPGMGKSRVIKRIADEFCHYSTPYFFHCSFSPATLDAVFFPALGFLVADNCPPHSVSSKYSGYFENSVSLNDMCSEKALLALRPQLTKLSEIKDKYINKCHRFLCAAATINSDTYRVALDYTDKDKINRFVSRFTYKYLKPKPFRKGRELRCFLTALTGAGIMAFPENARKLCNNMYIIDDSFGAVSRLLLNGLCTSAVNNGYDVISCRCPMSPLDKIEHLFIPDLSVGFVTSNKFHPLAENIEGQTINASRFTDSTILAKKESFLFNRKSVVQILSEAANSIAIASNAHEDMKKIYMSSINTDKIDSITQSCIKDIKTAISSL